MSQSQQDDGRLIHHKYPHDLIASKSSLSDIKIHNSISPTNAAFKNQVTGSSIQMNERQIKKSNSRILNK